MLSCNPRLVFQIFARLVILAPVMKSKLVSRTMFFVKLKARPVLKSIEVLSKKEFRLSLELLLLDVLIRFPSGRKKFAASGF